MTKEEVKQDMKNRAEDAQIIDEQQKQKETSGIRGWIRKKVDYYKKHPLEAVGKIVGGGILLYGGYEIGKHVTNKDVNEKVEEAWNKGRTDGVIAARIEHSPLTKEEKDTFFENNGWVQQEYRDKEKIGTSIIEEIKSLRNK